MIEISNYKTIYQLVLNDAVNILVVLIVTETFLQLQISAISNKIYLQLAMLDIKLPF